MRALLAASACAALLVGCSASVDDATVHRQMNQTLQTGSSPTVHVVNGAGTVSIEPSAQNAVGITATLSAHDRSALENLRVDVHQHGNAVTIATAYRAQPARGGADYSIVVPRGAAVTIENGAGLVDVGRIRGNVKIDTKAGAITADLGTVAGNRSVDLSTTAGAIRLAIAADSSASVDASSTVGNVSSSFPEIVTKREHMVSANASGTLGRGEARIRLRTQTGAIGLIKSAR